MNILIVDDHIMTIDGYVSLLERNLTDFKTFKALNCEEAYRIIEREKQIDTALIDYQIPPYEEKKIFNGADLALKIKSLHPNCKTLIITAHHESTIIYDIYTKSSPDALIIKNDISYATFNEFVLTSDTYISPTAKTAIDSIKKIKELHNDINRQILYYLKNGFKMNELHHYIPLSEGGIQKRVTKMREAFNTPDTNGLIKEATRLKFI